MRDRCRVTYIPNGLIPAGGLPVPAGSAFPNPTPLAPNPLAPNPFPGDVIVYDVTDISYVVTNEGDRAMLLRALGQVGPR